MAIHELKTDPDAFTESMVGNKKWEIRLNDRNFQLGDTLWLWETKFSGDEMRKGKPLIYTGRKLEVVVLFILEGAYGLKDRWCVMSVEQLRKELDK